MRRTQPYPPYTGHHYPDDERYEQQRSRGAGSRPARGEVPPYTDPRRAQRYHYDEWDEERYGHIESGGYERELQRGRDAYRPDERYRGGWRAPWPSTGPAAAPDGYAYRHYGREAEPPAERRGIKNYVRSDERIRDDLCERLYHSYDVEVGDVSLEVRDGRVILEGSVPQRYMKHRVEDLCAHGVGVREVENRIRMEPADRGAAAQAGMPANRDDSEWAREAQPLRAERPGRRDN